MLRRVKWFPVVAVLIAVVVFICTVAGWLDDGEGVVGGLAAVVFAILAREG
jgi:hypothetical protein